MSTFSATAFRGNMADLYLPFDEGMGPAIENTVCAVKKLSPDVASILDLGSGPGEPACTLAAAFPSASVISSDLAQQMVDLADSRAKNKGLSNVSTMILDITNLSTIQSNSQDVVTANFAIMTIASLEDALKEIRRVLKAGGFLIGTVWQNFSVPVLAKEVMTELLGEPPLPPPVDPMRLADAALLDAEFSKADFHFVEGHNALGDITFDLGPVSEDSTWKSVLISSLTVLEHMEGSGDTTIRERAKAMVEKKATANGLIQGDRLKCPGTFRTFRLAKSD